jgi:alginate O-acetyltransferase complex protein AlgJ
MGWGEGAGFGEQLSYMLQRPVDLILQNDAGAFATREMLAKELVRGRDRLSGKKVLIWQFAARELASGDWKKISLELQEKPESDFYTPLPNEHKDVTAVVVEISTSPVPGSVPYKDNVVTLHLDDIRDIETGEEYGQSLVYGWGMQDNVLGALAKIRSGEQIKIRLTDWDMVQGKYSSYRRTTLNDEMIELELPVWGELLQ